MSFENDTLTPTAFRTPVLNDDELLTPKEREQERKAQLEELQKRSWMSQSAQQLARRIPVSVFAIGSLAAGE